MTTEAGEFLVRDESSPTVLRVLKQWLPELSWSAARKLLAARRVAINGVLCLDEARRLAAGERVRLVEQALPPPPGREAVQLLHVDGQVIVVKKPAGIICVRPAAERSWPAQRRRRQPTLDELVVERLADRQRKRSDPVRLFPVHRLDRDTSGVLVFARDAAAQQKLIQQFADHKLERRYLALIGGQLNDQTFRSHLVRDRGDGRRGSGDAKAPQAKLAITHIRTLRRWQQVSELECRLETGRTNQIRIHLAEAGRPILGDVKYGLERGSPGTEGVNNTCPRLALHAASLVFSHPSDGRVMSFSAPWPPEMARYMATLPGAK